MKLHLQARTKPAIAQPRLEIPTECYIPKPVMVRPGSQDFLACKSRRGSEYVEHRGPISLAGAM